MAGIDELVERSAAPASVRIAIERLTESDTGAGERMASDRRLAEAVVAVLAASRSLARLIESDPAAIDVLARLDEPPDAVPDTPAAVARWKRLDLLRIAARDLLGIDPLEVTAAELASQAGAVLAAAHRIAGEPQLAVIGMGKLGGAELNYASDVDIMFVGEGDDAGAARALVDVARECFRVDLNLRPEGRNGALVRSVESLRGVLGALGPTVGVPGAGEGQTRRRQPGDRARLR